MSKWIRQTHRWLSITFTIAVIANIVAMFQKSDATWIGFLALVPLFILWFGIGETPKIALVALGSAFPIYLTLFAGIRQLEPGHLLIHERGAVSMQRYWDLDFPDAGDTAPGSADEWGERLRAKLDESVRMHLMSDVPV